MHTVELVEYAGSPEAELLRWQLEIARRADELMQSRSSARQGGDDWNCWMEAEREVLGRVSGEFPKTEMLPDVRTCAA